MGVQLLDGIGAGIYGALFPIVVAGIMRGPTLRKARSSPRRASARAPSTTLAGLIVVRAVTTQLLTLGAIAALGAMLMYVAMSETVSAAGRLPRPERGQGGDRAIQAA